jgi:hypothetical protein
MTDFINRQYNCKICNETHKIELPKNLGDGRTKYPFPYVFLHGKPKDILTILYIDKDLQIRGAEVQEGTNDLFSKEQVVKMATNLIDEVDRLREDNLRLMRENDALKDK